MSVIVMIELCAY